MTCFACRLLDVATHYGQLGGVSQLFSTDDVELCSITLCEFQCCRSAVYELFQQSTLNVSYVIDSIAYVYLITQCVTVGIN